MKGLESVFGLLAISNRMCEDLNLRRHTSNIKALIMMIWAVPKELP